MTVRDLIAELEKLPPESQVIIQKDAEGNGYSPLADVDGNAIYQPYTTWAGKVLSADWTAEEACYAGHDWEKFKADNLRCCVLAPVC